MRISMTTRFATVAALAALLAACGSDNSDTVIAAEGADGEYVIDTGTGETSATIEADDGTTTTMRTGENVPAKLPKGFAVYPGAKVVQNTRIEQAEGLVVGVTMETEDSAAKVAQYYTDAAKAAGYNIEVEMESGQTVMVGGSNEAGGNFTLNATESGDATIAMFNIADDMNE